MCHKLSMWILAAVGLAYALPVANCEPTVEYNITSSGCESPFQLINNGCYYFSDIQLDFNQAVDYCSSLTHGHVYEITLAMMDYDRQEDQALLKAVADKDVIFWVGGKADDNYNWKWIDNRDVNLQAPFWNLENPKDDQKNCMTAQKTVSSNAGVIRAYTYDSDCSDSLNFICKTGNIICPVDFIKLGNYCYMQSWTIGLPDLHWQEARDYCRFLEVPGEYHVDLAVLGLQDQEDYVIMNDLVMGLPTNIDCTWIGAYRDTEECSYQWIDGRDLPIDSNYWVRDKPYCGSYYHVRLYHWSTYNRTFIDDYSDSSPRPFICQRFKDN